MGLGINLAARLLHNHLMKEFQSNHLRMKIGTPVHEPTQSLNSTGTKGRAVNPHPLTHNITHVESQTDTLQQHYTRLAKVSLWLLSVLSICQSNSISKASIESICQSKSIYGYAICQIHLNESDRQSLKTTRAC